ncbi:aldo/keto reductase [Sphingopyxis terrae]|uniref:aldo/keto reductase n=1 Tax=Sphingopyxis terrae TaxID=33052 RepID=UPI002A0DA148|nr:aldo/keto reductase [Sphingopyxis terrae]MDX8356391.1 aldo/keto reductase [Sphingopyxis terrae]
MRFKLLGKTGLRVSELCLGAMTFGNDLSTWGASREDSERVFRAYVDAGGNFIDTANMYQGGRSEELLGEFLGAERQRCVVATKFTLGTLPGDPNSGGNQRKSIIHSLEGSLKRLKTDYVDLLWMHAWDQMTPQEEVLRALDDLVSAGKILYTGISDTPAWVVSRSQAIAELRGWTSFAALQLPYSLIERAAERELLPMAEALGLSVTAWGGLGNGLLSGKYLPKAEAQGRLNDPIFAATMNEANLAVAREVMRIAEAHGASASQVALAWIRTQSPFLIPIIGARTEAQLQDNLKCVDVALTEEDCTALARARSFDLGFPTTFLESAGMEKLIYGDSLQKIDVLLPSKRV